MATARKTAANRQNAARSTGPRTPAGKRRSAANAVTHGLRTVSPVLPGEDAADWDTFRLAVLADLNPVGPLEAEGVNRLAALQWRLRRVTVFEVAVAAAPPDADPARRPRLGWADTSSLTQLQRALEDHESVLRDARRLAPLALAVALDGDGQRVQPDDAVFLLDQAAETVQVQLPVPAATFDADGGFQVSGELVEVDGRDPALLAGLGVPAEFHDEPARWDGWTVGVIRAAFAALAKAADWSMSQLLRELSTVDMAGLEKRVWEARVQVDQLDAVARGGTAVPPDAALEVILRYESHLSRQVSQALEQLRALQALRAAKA